MSRGEWGVRPRPASQLLRRRPVTLGQWGLEQARDALACRGGLVAVHGRGRRGGGGALRARRVGQRLGEPDERRIRRAGAGGLLPALLGDAREAAARDSERGGARRAAREERGGGHGGEEAGLHH